jgi:hypothetical protein
MWLILTLSVVHAIFESRILGGPPLAASVATNTSSTSSGPPTQLATFTESASSTGDGPGSVCSATQLCNGAFYCNTGNCKQCEAGYYCPDRYNRTVCPFSTPCNYGNATRSSTCKATIGRTEQGSSCACNEYNMIMYTCGSSLKCCSSSDTSCSRGCNVALAT